MPGDLLIVLLIGAGLQHFGQLDVIASIGQLEVSGDGRLGRDVGDAARKARQEMARNRQCAIDMAQPVVILRVQQDRANVARPRPCSYLGPRHLSQRGVEPLEPLEPLEPCDPLHPLDPLAPLDLAGTETPSISSSRPGRRLRPPTSIRLRLAGGAPRSRASHSLNACGVSLSGCSTSIKPRSRRRCARIICSVSYTRGTMSACFSNESTSQIVLYPPMATIRSARWMSATGSARNSRTSQRGLRCARSSKHRRDSAGMYGPVRTRPVVLSGRSRAPNASARAYPSTPPPTTQRTSCAGAGATLASGRAAWGPANASRGH